MNTWLKSQTILAALLVAACNSAPPDPMMTMGDGTVRGKQLHDYKFSWQQCSFQDGQWSDGGLLAESLSAQNNGITVSKSTKQGNGISIVVTTEFDRDSLAPLIMRQQVTTPDGSTLATVERVFTKAGYTGEMRQGEQVKELAGPITSSMWDGNALGLPLATIDEKRYPVEFASSMVAFDGTYRTIATIAGREAVMLDGVEAEALLVDVEWHHNESGDVYAPGPDGSGGRYWLVPDPPEDMPYVVQYKTDSYFITVLSDSCPESKE